MGQASEVLGDRHTQTHTQVHNCTLPPYLPTVGGMSPRLVFVQRQKRTRLWFTYVKTSSDRLANQAEGGGQPGPGAQPSSLLVFQALRGGNGENP